MALGELTFNDYREKKFFVSPDFKCFKYESGDLIEIHDKITEDTFQKINLYISGNFFVEVEKQFNEIKANFEKHLITHYDKEHLIKAEINTIKQILRGETNSIFDTFGVTHIVIKYINGMPIVESELIKLSPVFNIYTTTLSDIRRYMANDYGLKASNLYFIENPRFVNKSIAYVKAEVFIKYFDFLKNLASKPKLSVPNSISFSLKNYQTHFDSWNANHDNQLIDWIKSGLILEIEKGLFVSKEVLNEQNKELDKVYSLFDLDIIKLNSQQQQIETNCRIKANKVKSNVNDFFSHIDNQYIKQPLYSLCPKIVEQPQYLLEANEKYPDSLPEQQIIYYRYKYLYSSRLNFALDQYYHYRNSLLEEVRKELSYGSNEVVRSVFLFMEQFIDELNNNNISQFKYFESPLFETLFAEIIKFKGYYVDAYGQFAFPEILKIEAQIENKAKNISNLKKEEESICFDDPINEVSITKASGNKYNLNSYINDHQQQQTLVSGFCIYFLWQKRNAENIMQLGGVVVRWVDDKPKFFNEYYNPIFQQKVDVIEPDKEFPLNNFLDEQIQSEKENLSILVNLPNYKPEFDIKDVIKWTNEYIDWLIKLLNEADDSNNNHVGFSSKLNKPQIKKLFKSLKPKFISKETEEAHFNAIFNEKPLPVGFKRIKWVDITNRKDRGGKQSNKSSLGAFLNFTMVFKSINPNQTIVNSCFTDIYNKDLIVGNLKKDPFFRSKINKFKAMIET